MTSNERMEHLHRWFWNIMFVLAVWWGVKANISIWTWALNVNKTSKTTVYAETAAPSQDDQQWRLDGNKVFAHHVQSTAPNWGGDTVTVTGFNSNNEVIWSVGNITKMERLK